MIGELFQPLHLLVILIIALFVFGPDKLPQLGANLGRSLKEFRKSMDTTQYTTTDIQEKTPNKEE